MPTTTTAQEVAARVQRYQGPYSLRDDFMGELLAELERVSRIRFPHPRYQLEPVAFAREILGVDPWSRQAELLNAVRDHKRVAVASGHKVGKSSSAAMIALWYYCSFDDARAILTSTTARQVDQILWREVRMMRARGGRCVPCKLADPDALRIRKPCEHSSLIDGEQGELARTGLKSEDFREIVGFTAREAEAVAGISGKNLLYIGDEASGIPDVIFEAMEGNAAGGARSVLLGNPTRNSGEFFDAFHSKKAFYFTLRISSEETPNVKEGREVIPGLATREWVEEKKREWGPESPIYRVRVKGEHARGEEGKIFSLETIGKAEERWHHTAEAGRLFIGLDPSGATGLGDDTVFAPRRGLKVLKYLEVRGLSEEAITVQLLKLIADLKVPREVPVVVLDREGDIGAKLFGYLLAFLEQPVNRGAFELVSVRASDRAVRQPLVYDRLRDELAANLEAWVREGGALPENTKLSGELHLLEWKQDVRGRLKVTPKDVIRKELGRSPDHYDATALAVWEPLSLQDDLPPAAQAVARRVTPRRVDEDDDGGDDGGLDPYEGSDRWGGKR